MHKRTNKKKIQTLHSIYQNIRNIDLLFKDIHKQPQVGPSNKNEKWSLTEDIKLQAHSEL